MFKKIKKTGAFEITFFVVMVVFLLCIVARL